MIEMRYLIHTTAAKINNKRLAMNRPLYVILSFTVSTLAALAVSGALHAQALSAPVAACVIHFDTPLSACDNAIGAAGAVSGSAH